MDERLIQILKGFKPLIIKAKFESGVTIPKHIQYIYDRMMPAKNGRCFGFRVDADDKKYVSIFPDPEYGKYPFNNPGTFERNDNLVINVIHRLEDTWGLQRDSITNWFEFISPES